MIELAQIEVLLDESFGNAENIRIFQSWYTTQRE